MNIVIVVQRYGNGIIGGAEAHAQQLATWLEKNTDWNIEIVTSCATSYITWKNKLDKGISKEGKILINRFPTFSKRRQNIFSFWNRLTQIAHNKTANITGFYFINKIIQEVWLRLQGPYCRDIPRYLKKIEEKTDLFIFFTYLYYPTVKGILQVQKKSLLIPTAHDEPPFYFKLVSKIFQSDIPLIVNSEEEARLIKKTYPETASRIIIGAIGLPDLKPTSKNIVQKIYILYLGRIGLSKRTDELIDYVTKYNSLHHEQQVTLVLAGAIEKDFQVENLPNIEYKGIVSEREKSDLIFNCQAVVNASRLESLSMIALEGILAQKPLILTAHCPVLNSYCQSLETAYAYKNYSEFEKSLLEVMHSNQHAEFKAKLSLSRQWALSKYGWEKVRQNIEQVLVQKNSSSSLK
ncbi:MAG: glycosyltransferase [Bdellovibrionota bacterium]